MNALRGEMICADISAFVLLFFTDSEGWVLDRKWIDPSRLDDFCLLVAGFFIEAKTSFAKRVELGHLTSTQIPDFKKFRALYYYASLILFGQ